MPGNLLTADTNFPKQTGNTQQDVKTIMNYLYMLLESLRYTLSNLDTTNWNADALSGFVDEIQAGVVTAQTVISNTVITNTLAANKATISELTVDQLDTSNKVQKFLNSDVTDDNYQRIYNMIHELVTASTDGAASVQASDRYGNLLYWTDETHAAAAIDATEYPVYIYEYTELTKLKIFFYQLTEGETTYYVPAIRWGAGQTDNPDNDVCIMYKKNNAFVIDYTDDTGKTVSIQMSDFVDANMRRVSSCAINKTAGTITVLMEGQTTPEVLTYTETDTSMTITWPDSHAATFSIS